MKLKLSQRWSLLMATVGDKSGNSPVNYRADDSRDRSLEVSFGSATTSSSILVRGKFTVGLSGLTGGSNTVQLQRSFDDGATFVDIVDSYDTDTTANENGEEYSAEGLYYRFECTTYGSGTAVCKLVL
jgi:hypothetical protein